jgi:hypothetical protein
MQQSVPFARISLFFSWVIFGIAFGWVVISFGGAVLLASNGSADGALSTLAGGVTVALPGIGIMILAAIGGVQAELSTNQNRYQNVMLRAHSEAS